MSASIMKIWIIDRDAGLCVFNQTFENLPGEMDSDLIGGFFIALMNFSQEIAKSSIELLQLKALRFYFYFMTRYLLILASPVDFEAEKALGLSMRIQKRFETKYGPVLNGKFNGDVSIFNDFDAEVEAELGQPCLCHSHFDETPELLHQHYEKIKTEWQHVKSQFKKQLIHFDSYVCKSGKLCQMKAHFKENHKAQKSQN